MDNYKEQFSQIYDQYIDKIYRFVYLKVSSQEVAEDLTSKIFLKGWEAFQSQGLGSNGQGIKNPSAFLYQIARNVVVDHYREKGKSKVVTSDFSQIVSQEKNLEEKAIADSDFNEVKLAMQNLKPEYQDIIIYHYIDGMKTPEIAEVMNKPEGTVRVMLHRGLKSLKEELEKRQIQES